MGHHAIHVLSAVVGNKSTPDSSGSVTPDSQATSSFVEINVDGAGFSPGSQVELVGSTTISASNVFVDSFSQIRAVFDLAGANLGEYSVRVITPTGEDTITNAFSVIPEGQAELETRLIMPEALGRGSTATIYVEYANVGNTSMPAPLLVLKSADPDNSDKPILTLDGSRVYQSYWSGPHESHPPGTSDEVFILASGSQPGILAPGERSRIPVYYIGLLKPIDLSDSLIEMEIRYWTADEPTLINWASRKESLRPMTLGSEQWDAVFENLVADLASTGDYIAMLSENAQYLGRLGENIVDVDDLWNFELQQAYGLNPVSILDSVVDAYMPATGVTLDFGRQYSNSLNSRFDTGIFGRGWFSPWEAVLVEESGGDIVRIVGDGGSARVFSRDLRDGSYFSGAGDSAALRRIGSAYELVTPGGIVTRFRPDGLISYVESPNGNRVTASWNANDQLEMLSHTNGSSIAIQYNGTGLIESVGDSAGRTTSYEYDPTDTYLTKVTTQDGKETLYTYNSSGSPSVLHALRSITRNGTTQYFNYDSKGRLDDSYLTAGEEFVDFEYDSAGI